MNGTFGKTTIVYLCYNDEPYKHLERMIDGVIKQENKELLNLLVVYNPGKEDKRKTIDFIKRKLGEYEDKLPPFEFMPQEQNLGYVGGNNAAIQRAVELDSKYIFLHNADGFLAQDCISKLTKQMNEDEKIGASQPLILLYPQSDRINSSGGVYNFLGFGYCGDYNKPIESIENINKQETGFASGAALMLRADLIKKYKALDKDYFI